MPRAYVVFLSYDWRDLRSSHAGNEVRTESAAFFGDQLILREIAQPEELPPRRFGFAPMPVETMREQPSPLLLITPLGAIRRNIGRASGGERDAGRAAPESIEALRHRDRGDT